MSLPPKEKIILWAEWLWNFRWRLWAHTDGLVRVQHEDDGWLPQPLSPDRCPPASRCDALLKVSQQKIELLTYIDMVLMIEKGIHEGISEI